MNKSVRFYLTTILFFPFYLIGFGQKTFFAPRSQSFDIMSTLMGVRRLTNHLDQDTNYSLASWTASYNQSFDGDDITRYFFGASSLIFSGSRYAQRGSTDILADYFGLSTTAKSAVCFQPTIDQYTNDFYWYLGLDHVARSLYMSVRLPIVHAVWDLRMSEQVVEQGVGHPAGYMGATRIELSGTSGTLANQTLASGVKEFFSGSRVTTDDQIVPLIIGDMQPLQYGKIIKRQTATRASEVVVMLGYNFWDKQWWSFGGNLRVAFPSGNHSDAEYLFEAMIGNGGHWEVGAGLKGYVDVWHSPHGTCAFSLHGDGQIAYLCPAKQRRSFDFKTQGNGSRYMLLEQLGQPSHNLFLGSDVGPASPYQYDSRVIPAINATTLELKTSIPVQGELVVSGLYEYKQASLEVGYNLFGRMKERAHGRDCFASGIYAFKGDAQLYGFDSSDIAYALAATENSATLHAGQGVTNFVAGSEFANDNIDTPVIAANAVVNLNDLTAADAVLLGISQNVVHTSSTPILLDNSDINVCSGLQPWAVSHRVFAHVSNYWDCDDYVTPFLGVGGFVEWAQGEEKCVGLPNQWNIALKGGVLF